MYISFYFYRKNHGRAMESMQASLEAEQRSKAEALRIKKKLEGEINELEIALDHANKANNEAQKSIKRYQVGDIFIHKTIFVVIKSSTFCTFFYPIFSWGDRGKSKG